ncbi:integrase [Lichenifustis flavocetrariae]|uniref:Integrase n=1 Tax=Lichenifustis flavocetrariae TaxID=2949735 RepID=A0AA42CS54_9HYPH|nr:integrase [Lichenifustis flavocetrariae]MCW6513145.1 integrase [Lichenifustis flavocetrariae]
MRSGRPEGDAPGRSDRRNRDGSLRVYWVAAKEAAKAGYEPATVRIHEADAEAISARCRVLQAEMQEWLAERSAAAARPGKKTINFLIREYRSWSESPFQEVKWNTRRTYGKMLDKMERAVGQTELAAIALADIKRWYAAARYPDGKGRDKPDQVRTAHGFVSMLRRIVSFGVAIEMKECVRLAVILANARFEAPAKRVTVLELEHIEAVRVAAHAAGRPSLAIGMALQWELMLRQRDVIGEWEPIDPDIGAESPFVINGRQWVNGLTWEGVSPSWILTKVTTKTGSEVRFDLSLCPTVMEELNKVPLASRRGPLVIDENADPPRPYAEHAYHREWRIVADAAKVHRGLFNMDARAGGATEAGDAGADLDDIRPTMGHARSETTVRYLRGTKLAPSSRVASARAAHRSKKAPNSRSS